MSAKRTRNPQAPLGPGHACDRVLALRRELQSALLDAQAAVIDRYAEKEQAIIARVPDDLKAAALRMIAAADYDADEPTNGAAATCATGEHVYDADGACIAGDAAIEPSEIPARLLEPVPPLPPGAIIEGKGERRVGKARA